MKIEFPKTGYLRVKVTPKSPQTKLTEILNEVIDDTPTQTYKIRIKAAPEKGKANKELIKFLAKELSLPTSAFSIISGKTDRIKLIKISQ